MGNLMIAKQTCLVGFVILCMSVVCENRVNAEDRKIEPVKSWAGLLAEKGLTELAPAKGYVTTEAEWKKLWEAWRPGEKVPVVNFTTHLVLVGRLKGDADIFLDGGKRPPRDWGCNPPSDIAVGRKRNR